MTKIEINLVLAGTAVCSVLVYGLVNMGHPNGSRNPPVAARSGTPAAVRQLSPDAGRLASAQAAQGAASTPDAATAASALPANATAVSDQALLRLSGMVNIANSVNERPNKAEWRQALPVAEKLLVCPCDCAQRNWLSHFVEMGNYALAGSEEKYNESAQIIVTLGRNNDQAVALAKGKY